MQDLITRARILETIIDLMNRAILVSRIRAQNKMPMLSAVINTVITLFSLLGNSGVQAVSQGMDPDGCVDFVPKGDCYLPFHKT